MEAQYTLKTYIESLWTGIGESIELTPGRYGPHNSDETYGVYIVIPNRDFLIPAIHTDNMQIRLYHKNYDKLSAMLEVAQEELNGQNPQINIEDKTERGVWTAMIAEGHKLHEIATRTTMFDQNEFIEGSEYYTAFVDIMFQYVEV